MNPVKPGWQTTEFWMTLGAQITALAALFGFIPGTDVDTVKDTIAKAIEHVAALAVIVGTAWKYIHSRAVVKSAQAIMESDIETQKIASRSGEAIARTSIGSMVGSPKSLLLLIGLAGSLLLLSGRSVLADPPPNAIPGSTLLAQQPLSPERPVTVSKTVKSSKAASEKLSDHRPDAKFRDALLEAAEQARRDGDITRWQLASIRVATWRHPELVRECQDCVLEEARAAGLAGAAEGAIDWMAIIDFIKALLPLILQIISIFSGASVDPSGGGMQSPFIDAFSSAFSLAA